MKLSDRGFSLIELMLAVAILSVVITSLLFAYIQCMLLNESSSNLATAVTDAQYTLEQIKALAYNEIANYTAPTFNNLQNETIILNRSISPSISTITINVAWQERQRTRAFSLSTFIAK